MKQSSYNPSHANYLDVQKNDSIYSSSLPCIFSLGCVACMMDHITQKPTAGCMINDKNQENTFNLSPCILLVGRRTTSIWLVVVGEAGQYCCAFNLCLLLFPVLLFWFWFGVLSARLGSHWHWSSWWSHYHVASLHVLCSGIVK